MTHQVSKLTSRYQTFKRCLHLRSIFTAFILFMTFNIFWCIIHVSRGDKTKQEVKVRSIDQSQKYCLISSDACLACNEPTLSSTQFTWANTSCDPCVLYEYNRTKKTFSIYSRLQTSAKVTCPRNVRSSKLPLPRTALMSWPGSGNTWTRHLVQQLTGIESGAIYVDNTLKYNGFPGEGKVTNVAVVKIHSPSRFPSYNFTKQILLLRNPYYAIVAEYKRSRLHANHAGKAKIFPNEQWSLYVEHRARRWAVFLNKTLHFLQPKLIVMYEDLRYCLLRELLRMSAFLATPMLTKFSVCCALQNSVGHYYRNQGRAPLLELYNEKLREKMNNILSTAASDAAPIYPLLSSRLLEYILI